VCILGDPGADSGGKSERANKKVGEEKSRAKRKASEENVSPEYFLTVKPVLASAWL